MKRFTLIALALIATSCGKKHDHAGEDPQLPAIAAEKRVIAATQVPVYEEIVGTVVPRQQADVSAKVSGRVLEMKAVPGMRVRAGEVLATLDVGELDAALQRSTETLAQADRDLARYRNLLANGAATPAEFEQSESRQRIAAATVAETRSLVANAQVTAPFDGTITRKFQELGDLAAPGRPLFGIEDASLLRLQINVAESLAGTLELGDKLGVEITGTKLEATVSELAPSADTSSRTFSVKLDLPQDDALRVGQFGRAALQRGQRAALSVPSSSVISRGQMDYVFVAEDQIARLRIVRSGEARDGQTEILAGLDAGETIVLTPPAELRDGQPLAAN